MTDHLALIFKCEISGNKRGKGFWKLNTSILKESSYCNVINNFFDKLPDDIIKATNHKTKWELIKFKIKVISIEYCKNRSKNFKKRIHEIENEIEKMENQHFTEINMIKILKINLIIFMKLRLKEHKFDRELDGWMKVKKIQHTF